MADNQEPAPLPSRSDDAFSIKQVASATALSAESLC